MTLYDEIKPNPTIKNVTDGVEACKKSKADVIVAVGGGSSMDTCKRNFNCYDKPR